MRMFVRTYRASRVLLAACVCTAVCFLLYTDLSADGQADDTFPGTTADPDQSDWTGIDSSEVEDLDFLKFLRASKQGNQVMDSRPDRNQTYLFRYNIVLIWNSFKQ